ncbi:MAG: hypothetical protein P1P65_10215 [Treponema sp.]
MKRRYFFILLIAAAVIWASCGNNMKPRKTTDGLQTVQKFSAQDIALWQASMTPDGSAKGSAKFNPEDNGYTVITVGTESWGGVQSQTVSLDMTQPTYIGVRIKECSEPFNWTLKFVPDTPMNEDHKWGFYMIEDNNIRWDKYVLVNVNEQIGDNIIKLYGGKIEGKLLIWAAGAANAQIEVREIIIFHGNP